MRVEPGQMLLHYRLVEKIGEGGMGAVWRAVDTTLQRDVALKLLPEAFAADPERLARFEREAKVLASLNHPGIAAIYGLHEAGGQRFLALELVEGEDLSTVLRRGPLPLEQALKVGRQVALALEAAHQGGVVHRDLKPANVRIATGGAVKVLDLGLAKAMAPDAASGTDSSLSPTVTSAGTVAGMILGTAAYMSPEQARGGLVDQRTDVWAWGCLMFEMLTGGQLFAGETVSDCIAAILKSEPPWVRLPPRTPWLLRRLLARCLARDPAERLHAIADARLELDDLDAAPPVGEVRAGLPRWAGATIGLLTLLAAAFGALWLVPRGGRSTAPARGLTVMHQTFYAGEELFPKLSADGAFLVYSAETSGADIFLERVGGHNPINLTKHPDSLDIAPAFSFDGSSIAFVSSRDGGGIFVMGATGENLRRLTDEGFDPAWSPDGREIVYADEGVFDPLSRSNTSALHVVDVAGGPGRKIYDGDAVQPSWSPHGKRIAFWAAYDVPGQRDILTVRADGTDPVPVTSDVAVDWNPVWSPDGRYLYFVSDRGGSMNLWRVPIDEDTGRPRGPFEPVTVPAAWAGWISVAAGGKIAYASVESRSNIHRVPLDPATLDVGGPEEAVTRGAIIVEDFAVSSDAEWLVLRNGGVQEDLYLARSDGSELRKLTDDIERDRGPAWAPDNQTIVFYSNRDGSYRLWTIRRDGSGLRRLSEADVPLWFPSVSPNGKTVAVWDSSGAWLFAMEPEKTLSAADGVELPGVGPEEAPLQGTSRLRWSPDGRYLGGAYEAEGVWFYNVAKAEFRSVESSKLKGPAVTLGWFPDGRALVGIDGGLWALELDSGRATPVAPSLDDDGVGEPEVSADGKWLYFLRSSSEADVWIAE